MSNPSSEARYYVIRLEPGDDLKNSLREFAVNNQIEAAIIVTCVGSLTQCNLRFANQETGSMRNGHFEIVSLAGTLSQTAMHLHLCVSDERGHTIGGHVMDGNLVYTTAEIAIAMLPGLRFQRVLDKSTGYPELRITSAEKS